MTEPDPEIEQLSAEISASFPSESKGISHDEVVPHSLGDKVVAADEQEGASTVVYGVRHSNRQDQDVEQSSSPHSAIGPHLADLVDNRASKEEEEDPFKPYVEPLPELPFIEEALPQPAIGEDICKDPNDEGVTSQPSVSQISANVPEHPEVEGLAGSEIEDTRHVVAPAHVQAVDEEDEEGPDSTDFVPLLYADLDESPTDDDNDILIKVGVPEGHKPLTAKPSVLTSTALITVLIFNFCCAASMVAILLRSGQDRKYYTSHPSVQFVIRYIPSFVGTITTLAARTTYFAFNRLEFYLGMADPPPEKKTVPRDRGILARPYSESTSWHDLYNHLRDWSPWHSRFWLRLIVVINALLISFLTSFKSTFLLASASPTATDPNAWTVTVSPFSTLVLIVLYTINVTSLVSLLAHLWSRCTGLKWDPLTIADHLALFHESNVLGDFKLLERHPDELSRRVLANKEYRIGYWEKGKERMLVYGIGRENHTSVRSELGEEEQHGQQETGPVADQRDAGDKICTSTSHLPFCTCQQEYRAPRDPHSRNSYYAPWLVCLWWFVCLASAIVCIYVWAQGVVENGFRLPNTWWKLFPSLISDANSTHVSVPSNTTFDPSKVDSSPANLTITGVFQNDPMAHDLFLYVFVFRNILVLLASLFAIVFMERVDLGHRFSQPFANMARSDASATESILLNYHWGTPGIITIEALKNSHWRVALFSLVNLISPPFPIFVAGLFTLTNTGDWIVFDIHGTSFYLVFAYLVVYTLVLPFAWPTRDRRLPRFFLSIADLMSLCYASNVLKNPALDISGANTTQKHLEARLFLQEETYRIGLYTGRDGRRHFGFDTTYLTDDAGNTVEHVRRLRKWPEDKAESSVDYV